YFITAVSSAAKKRTIRLKTYTVNTFSGIFLGNIVISLSDKVFYFCQMLRRLQQSLPPPPLTDAPL
ncbi:hypothetical protein, partial [Neisseria polysaccharea]|uniref:hypothetical protein n=1 Tax=Neisseria polysaccharea TaxID=489 RepID=UPI0027E18F8D